MNTPTSRRADEEPLCLMSPVCLTGYMGAGKTTVGRELALRLGCSFIDLDTEIEAKSGRSIGDIFATDGEDAFRTLERNTLEEILRTSDPFVLSLGGGTLQTSASRDLIEARKVHSFYLEAPIEELWRRCSLSPTRERPLLAMGETAFRDRFSQRERNYRNARATIGTMGKSLDQVVTDCIAALRVI